MRFFAHTLLMAALAFPIQGRESQSLYCGGPVQNPLADAFLRYMALMGHHRFHAAWRLRYGISQGEFLVRSEREWDEYRHTFRQRGFTFHGWRIRVLHIEIDPGGNIYAEVDQIFDLERSGRRLFRHAGFLFRVTFVRGRIHTVDPIRGLFIHDEWERPEEGS